MLATRQVLGNVARSRAMANLSLRRTMATVTDSPLDKKVCPRGRDTLCDGMPIPVALVPCTVCYVLCVVC